MKPTLRVEPNYIIALVLVVAVGVCYQPVRDFDFIVLDDPAYIVDNHWVKNGLTRSGLYWSVSAIHAANWHPLTWISHMLDCELFRCEPGAHHLVNVFFHLINSFLLWILMRRISGRIWPAGVAAILFAVHPINVEVVAWVAQRKTLLCTLFGLLTLLAYHRYTENRKTATYLPVLVFFALGLMAKPMIVTLPGVMLLLDYWPLNRLSVEPGRKCRGVGGWAPLIAEKAPLLGISSVSAVITFFAQHHGGAVAAGDALSTGMRISNAVVSYAGYLKKMMWPEQLAVVYPHPLFIPPSQVALSAVLLSGITLFVLLMRRRHPYLPVGWFWYMGTLLPVIGFIQVGVQAMADRYLYIPMIGLLLMLVWGVNACAARWRMGWKVPLASASIPLLSLCR